MEETVAIHALSATDLAVAKHAGLSLKTDVVTG